MSIIEAFAPSSPSSQSQLLSRSSVKELEDLLRVEYRSKLLNPKWAEGMLKQGSGGAYEISGRMTALIGWAGTCDFAEKWVFDGAAERCVE